VAFPGSDSSGYHEDEWLTRMLLLFGMCFICPDHDDDDVDEGIRLYKIIHFYELTVKLKLVFFCCYAASPSFIFLCNNCIKISSFEIFILNT